MSKDLWVYEHVTFTVKQNDVHKYLFDSSIYLLLSDCESYCYSLAEAKAFGLANINIGKKYLVLTKNGTIHIDSDEPKNLADACIKLLKNQTYLTFRFQIWIVNKFELIVIFFIKYIKLSNLKWQWKSLKINKLIKLNSKIINFRWKKLSFTKK